MSIFNYRLVISYNGEGYLGWQIQPDRLKTIQGQLNAALKRISKGGGVSSLASGRTDAGVHALGQVVRVTLPLDINSDSLGRALNSYLPKAIRVCLAERCREEFHPIRDALWKRYLYYILCSDILPPSLVGKVTHIKEKLNYDRIKEALFFFQGEHDFINFSTKGTPVSSTLRTLYRADFKKAEEMPFLHFGDSSRCQFYVFTFEGNGFLKQMVRLLVGGALMCGKGKVDPSSIPTFFQGHRVKKMGPVAPADGLYLDHVEYAKSSLSSH